MFKIGQEVFAVLTQKHYNKTDVGIRKAYVLDVLQNVENGMLTRKYMLSLMDSTVSLFLEEFIFENCEEAYDFSLKLQKEIDKENKAVIDSQVDLLFKNAKIKEMSLKEGLTYLLERGFIEIMIR